MLIRTALNHTSRLAAICCGLLMTGTVVAGDFPSSLSDYVERYGVPDTGTAPETPGPVAPMAAGTPGTLWNNGPSDEANAFLSQRPGGTGGPTGDHLSTIADDFVVTQQSQLTEIRACFAHLAGDSTQALFPGVFGPANTATLYIYRDNGSGGEPGPALNQPLFGAPVTPAIITSTFADDSARCTTALGVKLREYRFNQTSIGRTLPILDPGRYWLAVVGNESVAAYWATSNNSVAIQSIPQVGATEPSDPVPYWTGTTDEAGGPAWGVTASAFAFDIDGTPILPPPPSPAPGLTPPGLVLLISLLGGLGAWFVRRRDRLYRR